MHIKHNKEKIGCALFIVVLLFLISPRFISGGGLFTLTGKWLESTLFLTILILASVKKVKRTGTLWLILLGISLAGTILNILLGEIVPPVLPVIVIVTGVPDIIINLLVLIMMSVLLCWHTVKEKEERCRSLGPLECLICFLFLAVSVAVLILIGNYYKDFYANAFSSGMDLFSLMTSPKLQLIKQVSVAAYLIPKAVCIWVLAYGVFGVPMTEPKQPDGIKGEKGNL